MPDSPASALSVPGFPEGLLREIDEFVNMSAHNYRFNSRCDTFMNLGGIVLSISIVAAGVYGRADVATILGALVTAIITAQRASRLIRGGRSTGHCILAREAKGIAVSD